MTSLELFPERRNSIEGEPPEWGTGKLRSERNQENLWTAKRPTWQYSGHPDEQKYVLTQLKLSNVRMTDQLLPNPQHCEMGKLLIRKQFPAEHPYASHIERKATIPKFDSPQDVKRGVEARNQMPKNDEMPSKNYGVVVISKTKGSARRHELQHFPPESMKEPLMWPEGVVDQVVRSPTEGRQDYYPIPPKVYVPNLEDRNDAKVIKGNMVVGDRTATALRNVERNQWKTSYELNHTGLGPSNALNLDNHEDKVCLTARSGVTNQEVDQLQPRGVNTFDPARPFEGRIARSMIPKPAPMTDKWPNPDPDPNYVRPMTLTEREEDRLLNGRAYVNLPDNLDSDEEEEWLRRQRTSHPEYGLEQIEKNKGERQEVPLKPQVNAAPGTKWGPVEEMAVGQHDNFQQIEAQNRWKVLDLQTPAHNLKARQHKVDINVDKSQPKAFYDHEGTYQRERSGLYKTSYDPYTLQHSMNKGELSANHLFDISDCHKDALNLPTNLNEEMAEAMRWNRTLGGPPGSVPQLNSQPNQYEYIEPFNRHKSLQKAKLQPNAKTSDVRTQENGIVLKESEYGENYNTEKFLQEYELPDYARNEPLQLMSHENKNLQKVRHSCQPRLKKSVTWASDGPSSKAEKPRFVSAEPLMPIRASTSSYIPLHTNTTGIRDFLDLPVKLEKDRKNTKIKGKYSKFGVTDQFASKSSNFTAPGDISASWSNRTSYQELHPGAKHKDLSFKNDERFQWRVGSGTPRPQTKLLDIQNSWSRSSARKSFHRQFPEQNPDLRENIVHGRQHEFMDLNAQVLRGTPIPVDAY